MEILAVDDLASLLRMSKKQIYTMTETRTRKGVMKNRLLPVLRVNGDSRFGKGDVDLRLAKLVESKAA